MAEIITTGPRLFPVLIFLLGLLGCTNSNDVERTLLLSELQEMEGRQTLLSQDVSARQQRAISAEARLKNLESDLSDYEGKVQAFMMNHKMAVVAIALGVGGIQAALDTTSFSDEVRQMGSVTAAIAAVYALSNAEEVTHVADQLIQAHARIETFEGQIQSTRDDLVRETRFLAREEGALETLGADIAVLRQKLRALQ